MPGMPQQAVRVDICVGSPEPHRSCMDLMLCDVQALREAQEEIHGGAASAANVMDAREQRKKKRLQAHIRKLAAQKQAQ